MNILEKRRQTFELVDKYADHLAKRCLDQEREINFELSGFSIENALKWDNPENLDSGTSGVILFLIAYYKTSQKTEYLTIIDQYIADVLLYCNDHPTNNYAFYTGRGGVIYILIQRYMIDKNENFLNEALNLIIPAKREFLNSEYTSDYLYDGRSGTLLLIAELYRITQAAFLLEYIELFLFKILSNLKLSGNSVFWNSEEEINLKPSCGFAYGAAGIRYVLDQLNQHRQHPILKSVIGRIDEFIASSWVEEMKSWADFRKDILDEEALAQYKESYLNDDPGLFEPKDDCSWANGTVGILFASTGANPEICALSREKLRDVVMMGDTKSDHLKDGLAGLGMCFLQENHFFDPKVKDEIINEITSKLSSELFEIILKGGLLNGNLGGIYFLLKAADAQVGSENILKPFYDSELKVDFSLEVSELRRNILLKYYPRTISLLENIEPLAFFEYLDTPGQEDLINELKRFRDFMNHIHELKMEDSIEACLLDLFQLEKQKIEFFEQNKDASFKVYIEDLLHHEYALRCFQEPKEWLMNRTLSVSKKVKIFSTKWKWKMSNDFGNMKEAQLKNLNLPSAKFEYIVLLAGKLEMVEFLVSDEKEMILLHQFDEARQLAAAISAIRSYMETPGGRLMIESLSEIYDEKEMNDFFDYFDDIVLYKIREWIYSGILILTD